MHVDICRCTSLEADSLSYCTSAPLCFLHPPLCSALLRSSEDSWSALKAAESNSSNQSKRYQGMMFFFARGAQRSTDLFERDNLPVTEPLTRQTARRKPRWRDVEPHGHPAGALAPDQNTNQTLVMKPCKS